RRPPFRRRLPLPSRPAGRPRPAAAARRLPQAHRPRSARLFRDRRRLGDRRQNRRIRRRRRLQIHPPPRRQRRRRHARPNPPPDRRGPAAGRCEMAEATEANGRGGTLGILCFKNTTIKTSLRQIVFPDEEVEGATGALTCWQLRQLYETIWPGLRKVKIILHEVGPAKELAVEIAMINNLLGYARLH